MEALVSTVIAALAACGVYLILRARTFADDEPVRFAIADTGHGLGAPFAQRTGPAVPDLLFERLPPQAGYIGYGLRARRCGSRCGRCHGSRTRRR